MLTTASAESIGERGVPVDAPDTHPLAVDIDVAGHISSSMAVGRTAFDLPFTRDCQTYQDLDHACRTPKP